MGVSSQEIRLKGSFKQIQVVYKEMFFVLHQILDRFDTVKFLRQQYGSAALEDLSVSIFSIMKLSNFPLTIYCSRTFLSTVGMFMRV